MPLKALALLIVLPALVACSTTSYQGTHDTQHSHQQALLQALQHWSPELDAGDNQPTSESSSVSAINVRSPSQAQALALQQSPAIRSILASQGIADADYRQATLINNPGFTASALRPEDSGSWKTEFGISFGILDWLTLPMRKTLAGAELESARTRALNALTTELGHVRSTYFVAVAARHASRQQQQTAEAARLNAELARQLHEAGNLSELARLRYENELARQQQAVHQAMADADARLAELKRSLGLPFSSELVIPDMLPDSDTELLATGALQALLQNDDSFGELLANTSQQRPDIRLLRDTRTALEHRLTLQQKQLGMSEFGLGFVTEREPDGSRASGIELDLSLPFFDRGQTAVASVRAQLEQLTADEQALQLTIAHQIRISLNNLLSLSQQIRQLRDQDIPRYQRMLELALQEYNFMLTGPFTLIDVKQEETEAVVRYIRLLEHYWVEYADLMQYSANTVKTFSAEFDPTSVPPDTSPASPAQPAPETESSNHQEHHHD